MLKYQKRINFKKKKILNKRWTKKKKKWKYISSYNLIKIEFDKKKGKTIHIVNILQKMRTIN